MRSAGDALSLLTTMGFVVVAAVVLARWRRDRRDIGASLALAIVALAAVSVLGRLGEILGEPAWLTPVSVAAFMASGWSLFVFRHRLMPVSPAIYRVATAAAAAATLLGVASIRPEGTGPLTSVGTLAVVGAWSVLVGEPAVRFWRRGRGQPVVLRKRLRSLSVGYLTIVAVLVVGVSAASAWADSPVLAVVIQSLTLIAIPLLFVSFAPPAWLRSLWRSRAEVLGPATEELLLYADDRRTVAQRALLWSLRGLGAGAGFVAVGDEVLASSGVSLEQARDMVQAARERRLRHEGVEAVVAALTTDTGGGLLVVMPDPVVPLFGSDELDWLRGYASSVSLALSRADLTGALSAAEGRTAGILTAIHEAYLAMDDEGRIVAWNDAAAQLFGWTAEEVLGRPAAETILPARHRAELERFLSGREIERAGRRTESVGRRRDGTEFAIVASLWTSGDSSAHRFHALVEDVSDRKASEASLALLQRAAAAANEATTTDDAIRTVLQAVCEHVGWPVGHAYIFEAGELVPTHLWYTDAEGRAEAFRRVTMETAFAPGMGLPGRVYEARAPAWIDDLTADPTFTRAHLGYDIEVRSGFAAPVLVGAEVVAILEFFSGEPVERDEALLHLVGQVGTQLGRVVERERAASELQASQQRFFRFLDELPVGVFIVEGDGRPVFTNRMAGELLGRGVVDVGGSELAETYDVYRAGTDTLYPNDELPVLRALHGERVYGDDIEIDRPDGRVPVEVWAAPVDEAGRIAWAIAAFSDVSERQRAQAEIAQASEELERSNRELEQFAYIASHDLQEPLRIVAGYVQLLERRYTEAIDDEGREFIEYVVQGVARMRQLIQDLLTYSRAGKVEKALEPVDTAKVVELALSNVAASIEESGATVDVADGLPLVLGDVSQLVQVFQNLVSNALKFRKPDEPPVVRIGAEPAGDTHWRFWVTDDGIGIEPEFAERIFGIFQRLHARSEYPGTGIGLTLCKKIVERFGGTIWMESQPGESTTFSFTLLKGES